MLGLIAGGYQIGSSIVAGRKAKKEAGEVEKEQYARIKNISGIYDSLISKYGGAGTYGKSLFGGLERQKQLSTGRSMQHLLRSGIGGTSFGDVQAGYERHEGRQARASLEDYLLDKRTALETQKARFLEDINISGPSYGDIAGAYSGVEQGIAEILRQFRKKEETPDIAKTNQSIYRSH